MPQGAGGVPGPADPGFGFIAWGHQGRPNPLSTVFLAPFGYSQPAGRSEAAQQWQATRDCSLWRFYCHLGVVPANAVFHTATVRVNGASSRLALTLNRAAGANVSDVLTQVEVLEGDLISLQLITSDGNAGDTLNHAFFALGIW
jgi:hypothetical protein